MSSGRKLGFTLLAAVLSLAAVEVAVRWHWADEVDLALLHTRELQGDLSNVLRYSDDPVLHYEVKPDLHLRRYAPGARLVTSPEGFRIRAEPRAPLPEVAGAPLRVAAVGGSTTFGHEIRLEDTYPELLVPRLTELWGRRVELRNFSVPAYNAIQMVRMFELSVLPWEPDLVLWHYDHRDAFPVLSPGHSTQLPPEFGENVLHSAAIKLIQRRLRARELARMLAEGGENVSFDTYFAAGPHYELHLEALERMASMARVRDLPVVVIVFDAFVRRRAKEVEHYQTLHVPLVRRFNALGLRVLDLFSHYQAVMTANGWRDLRAWWLSLEPLDGHPNPACHAFLADRVYDFLADEPDLLEAAH